MVHCPHPVSILHSAGHTAMLNESCLLEMPKEKPTSALAGPLAHLLPQQLPNPWCPQCGFGCPIKRRCPDLSGSEWAPEICLLNKQPFQPKDGGAAHLRMGKPRLGSRVVNIRFPGLLPPISPSPPHV